LTLFLGQTAVFECEVTAKPPAIVKWLKDDQPLVLDHRMKILPSGLLEITDVRMSDRAKYNCNASNEEASRISRSGDLRINLDLSKILIIFIQNQNSYFFGKKKFSSFFTSECQLLKKYLCESQMELFNILQCILIFENKIRSILFFYFH